MPTMLLTQILFSQGFGTRHECLGMVVNGHVQVGGQVIEDPQADFEPEGLIFRVNGKDWPYHDKALVLLNKPTGYECSLKPKHHPSVLSLLPGPLRVRGLQPVGRLDEDTTGLLLLTDDGALIHKLTHPKRKIPKIYDATLKHPMSEAQAAQLCQGVVLHDDPTPAKADGAELPDPLLLRMTLIDGRYHQVKRMVAAVSNRVEALHRSGFGRLRIPASLAPGQWMFVDPAEI